MYYNYVHVQIKLFADNFGDMVKTLETPIKLVSLDKWYTETV